MLSPAMNSSRNVLVGMQENKDPADQRRPFSMDGKSNRTVKKRYAGMPLSIDFETSF